MSMVLLNSGVPVSNMTAAHFVASSFKRMTDGASGLRKLCDSSTTSRVRVFSTLSKTAGMLDVDKTVSWLRTNVLLDAALVSGPAHLFIASCIFATRAAGQITKA